MQKLVPVGIVTDRDLVVPVLAEDADSDALTPGELMNGELLTAEETEVVYGAIWHMRSKGIRRLPMVNAGKFLVGVLSSDDVTEDIDHETGSAGRVSRHSSV